MRDAREGLVLLEVPLLAAVAVAAPGPARTVLGGVAVLHLKKQTDTFVTTFVLKIN